MPLPLPITFRSTREHALRELAEERSRFRAQLRERGVPENVRSHIGVVLSGGGARGAYEAGVLLAFQDARLPTHLLAATSVGSINAASYAAHADGLVGNAESLIESWSTLTPPALGIDWSRYIFMLGGLVAATAGIGNALREWMESSNLSMHMNNPILTWLALAAAGLAVLWFFDILPYVGYVAMRAARMGHWKPDYDKAWKSLGANILVWGFVIVFLASTHIHLPGHQIFQVEEPVLLVLLLLAPIGILLVRLLRDPLNRLSRLFLRVPLRTGLFANYERNKYLRSRIPEKPLQDSAMTVIFTATDLMTGDATFFTNKSREALKQLPLAQPQFIDREVEPTNDMLQAMIASSAYTIAYEAVSLHGRLWSDGGIITNQPIRPAVRLGADVLFLIFTDPLDSSGSSAENGTIKTFIDVGVNAISILLSKNLKTDMKLLDRMNAMCEQYARELGVRPEQVQLEVGSQNYRYVKAITIAPREPIPVNALDFNGDSSSPMIVQGYRDGERAIAEFIEYESSRPAPQSRQNIRLVAERAEGNFHSLR